jgi:hypothetical protein
MANGTLKVSNIQTSSGSGTITIGQSGETVNVSGTAGTGFGKVLQIATNSVTTEIGQTSSSYSTFFGTSITAVSASSKFLCILNATRAFNSSASNVDWQFTDGTNTSTRGRYYTGYGGTGSAINPNFSGIIYGSHSAGASLTINYQVKTASGTFTVGDNGSTSSMYIIEIA